MEPGNNIPFQIGYCNGPCLADVMTEGEDKDKGGRWDLIHSIILVYLDAGQVLRVASSTQ
jgi:hypothetical protein